MEPGFFPLDKELALLPGNLTPRLHEALVRLSIQQPSFAKAAAELAFFTGATVHADTGRRRTEAAGAVLLAHETAEAARILREHPTAPAGPDTLVFSVDGAMVPIVGGQWREVRTLAVGELLPPRTTRDGVLRETSNLSYFSLDGAEWCQSFIDYHYAEAVRILDHPHAAEHITLIGQSATPAGPLLSAAECARLRTELKQDGPAGVLAELRALVEAQGDLPQVVKALAYLEHRQAQMHYPQFVAEGWPIGSGMVESANKLVVEERLKGAGMHWAEENVNPLLALRNAWCNDRWNETWMLIERLTRRVMAVQHQERRARRRPVAVGLAPIAPEAAAPRTIPPAAPPTAQVATKPPHPWKRAWSIRRQRELAGAA